MRSTDRLVTAFRILGDDTMQSVVSRRNALGWEHMLGVDREPMKPVAAHWERSDYFIPKPSRRRGDIFDAGSGNFACRGRVLDKMHDCIARD